MQLAGFKNKQLTGPAGGYPARARRLSAACARIWAPTAVTRYLFIFALVFIGPLKAYALMDVENAQEAVALGQAAFDRDDFETASAYFEFAAEEKPKDAQNPIRLGECAYGRKDYAKAVEYFKVAKKLGVDSLTKKFLETAISRMEANPEIFNSKNPTLHEQAALVMEKEPLYMALVGPHWEEMVRRDSMDAALILKLADGYYGSGQTEKARHYTEILAKADPRNETLQERLADIFVIQKNYEKARTHYKKALRETLRPRRSETISKETVSGLLEHIRSLPGDRFGMNRLIEEREYDRALGMAKEALAFNPGDTGAMAMAARVYEEKGNLGEAERLYKKALETNPQSPMTRLYWGRFLYLKKNEYEKALAELKLSQSYLKEMRKNSESAEEEAEAKQFRIQTSEFIAYLEHEFLNKPGAAVKELETLFKEEDIQDPKVVYHLGVAYWKNKKRMSAYQAFKKALTLKPDEELKKQIENAIEIIRQAPEYGQSDETAEDSAVRQQWNRGVSY